VVAFAASMIVALVGFWVMVVWYGRRRPIGAFLSWGEAIVAATAGFALMFWAYGVVPHQWLTYANNELGWTPSKILWEAGEIEPAGIPLPPFRINYENISHAIVVGIYGLFLTMHVAAWVLWQNRAKTKPIELPTSDYGRPLVKQG
jgi:multisubunit Na+/H+ antiporter MnhB subunit